MREAAFAAPAPACAAGLAFLPSPGTVQAQLGATDMVPVYERLARTNFPTLYAATSPGDDFAESFVSYVHTVLMKRPREITIRHDGKVAKTYRTCWEEARCAAKCKILEDLLR